MKNSFSISIAAVALVGCATVGDDFNYENRANLEVGKTTAQEALGLLGKPSSVQTQSIDDDNYEIFQHVFGSGNIGGEGVSRVSTLEFKDNVLNSKVYLSSFEEDNTAFRFENVEQIVVDTSTIDDAVRLLGEPGGFGVCPSALTSDLCDHEGASSVVSWMYVPKTTGFDDLPTSKIVALAVSQQGIVVGMKTEN